jgi:hypothetical protein
MTRSIPIEDLNIRPGTTTTATVVIRQVVAHLRWPENMQRQSNWRAAVSLREIPGRQNPRGYSLSETGQGDFVAEDVLAGSYTLTATVTEPQTGGGAPKRLLRTQVSVAVPSDQTPGALDLGEILLQPAQ